MPYHNAAHLFILNSVLCLLTSYTGGSSVGCRGWLVVVYDEELKRYFRNILRDEHNDRVWCHLRSPCALCCLQTLSHVA